jgi:hypothetical protein
MASKAAILHAIKRHCLECSGGVRDEVALCTINDCSLYQFREAIDPDEKVSKATHRKPTRHS